MSTGGFVDLRLNHGRQNEESFWPSFTDIMTVIVMIFLLAMVTLLLKNMDLLEQLRASLAAERSAAEQIQSTSDQNWQLRQRLAQLEKEASISHMRLMDLSEEHRQTLARLEESRKQNSALQAGLERATADNSRLTTELAGLRSAHAALQADKSELERQRQESLARQQALQAELEQRSNRLATLQQEHQLTADELARLRQEFSQQQAELASSRSAQASQSERLQRLEQEYASLDKKYQRLIRPARSPVGKHVVQVRYYKQGGKLFIQMKRPADKAFAPISEREMHRLLAQIQGNHPRDLYIKIIFPDDSGLSYTEAWNLTESLLRQYDYYYQEQ